MATLASIAITVLKYAETYTVRPVLTVRANTTNLFLNKNVTQFQIISFVMITLYLTEKYNFIIIFSSITLTISECGTFTIIVNKL